MDEQKPDRMEQEIKAYQKLGLPRDEAEILAKNKVSKELEASREKRMVKGKPLIDAYDASKVSFDNAVTDSKEMIAYQKAKEKLDTLKNSEQVKPLKDAMATAKTAMDAFFEKNPDLRKGRGGSRSGAGRKSGYKGDVEITHTESGEILTFPTMNTAYRHVLGLRGEEMTHGIGWNQAKSAFGKEGWTIRQLGSPVGAEA